MSVCDLPELQQWRSLRRLHRKSQDVNTFDELHDAIQRYFNLMHDCDVSSFDDVFSPTAQLHGVREGTMVCWPAEKYKEILKARVSPQSRSAPRQDAILLIDVASTSHALVKVEVRIHDAFYQDYLTYHKYGSRWLITSKGYHLMRTV